MGKGFFYNIQYYNQEPDASYNDYESIFIIDTDYHSSVEQLITNNVNNNNNKISVSKIVVGKPIPSEEDALNFNLYDETGENMTDFVNQYCKDSIEWSQTGGIMVWAWLSDDNTYYPQIEQYFELANASSEPEPEPELGLGDTTGDYKYIRLVDGDYDQTMLGEISDEGYTLFNLSLIHI